MSLVIDSNDVASGTVRDGTWNFSGSILGSYTIIDQHMSVANIPWCWSGVNELFIGQPVPPFSTSILVFPEISTNDSTEIITWLSDAFNSEAFSQTTSITYDADTDQYTINFVQDVAISYLPDAPVPGESSSIAYVFDWVYHEPNEESITDVLTINGRFMKANASKFIEVRIEECGTEMINTRNTNPTFLMPQEDFELTGQVLDFQNETQELNISFYRPNIPIVTVPFTNSWQVILK